MSKSNVAKAIARQMARLNLEEHLNPALIGYARRTLGLLAVDVANEFVGELPNFNREGFYEDCEVLSALGVEVPSLDVDARRRLQFGTRLTEFDKLERRIAAALIHHLQLRGFNVAGVDTGDTVHHAGDAKEALEWIFSDTRDDAVVQVNFQSPRGDVYGVHLEPGTADCLVLPHHTYLTGDRDGFHAAIKSFDAIDFA